MPTFKEYTSSVDKLNPDERGYTAWETAGRRIGPLYNQAASDIERGGKLDAQMIEQADKLNAHELDYLGLLGKQQARAGGGGGGGSGGHSGGSQPSQQPLRTYNPGPSIASAAANLTGAAAALTGHQEGRGIYGPLRDDMTTRTDTGGYNQQNFGGLSDNLTPAQVKAGLAQGDALYQQRLAGDATSYTSRNGYNDQRGAGMGESMGGPYAGLDRVPEYDPEGKYFPRAPGFLDNLPGYWNNFTGNGSNSPSADAASAAYGGSFVADTAQSNQGAITPDDFAPGI